MLSLPNGYGKCWKYAQSLGRWRAEGIGTRRDEHSVSVLFIESGYRCLLLV